MRRAVFLQARMGSTRLPGKAVVDLGGLPILVWCFRSLSPVPAEVHALLTDAASVDRLGPLARSEGWEVHVGDAEDVLQRFVSAARRFAVDVVLRATADNPLVSAALAADNLQRLVDGGWDLHAWAHSPLGTGTEAVRVEALIAAWESQPDAYEREHVTPYLYRHPERFRVGRPTVSPNLYWPEGRVTLDTEEDLFRLRRLVSAWGWMPPVSTEAVVNALRAHG